MKKYNYQGFHAMADILLNGKIPDNFHSIVIDSISKSNLNVVSEHVKEFEPQGSTAVFILSESHFTYHTYPESNYVTVCCYTCGEEGDPMAALEYLVNKLNVKKKKLRYIERGIFE